MFVWLQMKEYPSYADDVVQIHYVWCFLADGGLQCCIHLLLWLQRVPLGHWTPGIGQHV